MYFPIKNPKMNIAYGWTKYWNIGMLTLNHFRLVADSKKHEAQSDMQSVHKGMNVVKRPAYFQISSARVWMGLQSEMFLVCKDNGWAYAGWLCYQLSV